MAVVLLTDNHLYAIQDQVLTTTMVLIVIVLTSLILLAANKLQDRIGSYGITVISKIMGMILAAYAVQSILTGITHYFTKI